MMRCLLTCLRMAPPNLLTSSERGGGNPLPHPGTAAARNHGVTGTGASAARRFVAFVTALLLLMCQTAVAAQACDHPVGSAYAADAQPPCHATDDAAHGGSHGTHALSACDAAKAVGDAVKIPLADVTDLPALSAAILPAQPLVLRTAFARAPAVQCHPPPLNLLHCRMLV